VGYNWDFSVVWRNFDMLMSGLGYSLWLTFVSLIFGLLIGLLIAPLRMSKYRLIRYPVNAYVAVFRNTPPLVQLFWFFFAFPILISLRFSPFQAGVFTFSLQSGAFFTEIYRGGIQAIDQGQWEAGKAIGMNYLTLMRRIILPQAIKMMIPAFFNRAIELFKTTTLVSIISYSDLLYQAQVLSSQTFRPLEIYTVVALIYFVVIFIASLGVRQLENRLAQSDA